MSDCKINNIERFEWPIRVYYEDTDAGGVVYHSQYLNFLERTRTEWLRSAGLEQEALFAATGARFVVTHMAVDFISPARLDDLLTVTVSIRRRRQASFELEQTIERDGARLIAATARIACVGEEFKPIRIPAQVLQQLFE
ncbi:tol-pal system-associated acyl-CoA thioesterase [Magnetofaba australis]|uniref:Putative thioesterase n=1 Tax=Magnetofaba australis IT-1 TaxID=1434232 RepID=A0A1Y2K3Y9_9PROT|nr:tol-pal system-associated acyl-CoA thioesterase [Magnetofaba australis]OSM01755.1 putative thioesterase [Magnetofaba australis IT-1]